MKLHRRIEEWTILSTFKKEKSKCPEITLKKCHVQATLNKWLEVEARRSKGAYLERKIKGVLRQRKDEMLNGQKTLLL